MSKLINTFQFSDLEALREWLNQLKTTDLSAINPHDSDFVELRWTEVPLTDGTAVINFAMTTGNQLLPDK